MFEASDAIGRNKMVSRTSNLEDAYRTEQDLVKRIRKTKGETSVEFDARNAAIQTALELKDEPKKLYKKCPGLSEEKQVDLFTKYRPIVDEEFRNELCPEPPKEVMENVLNLKKDRKRMRADFKDGNKIKKNFKK